MHLHTGLALTVLVTSAVCAPPAEAQPRGRDPGYGTVTAESRYGTSTITAPVRAGRNGYEVRLPGGTWVECGRSCRDTLRRETVDFWASRDRSGTVTDGPGYLRFRF